MEYDKINDLLLYEDNESEQLSKFVNLISNSLIVYLKRMMKINQLDLKHLC